MLRSYQKIKRRVTKEINVGDVKIGGSAPISVQTMTNTLTSDVKSTVNQIKKIEKAGADLVRVSVPDEESSKSLKEIVKKSKIPVIADVHFHYKRAIESANSGASCLRINPGNIGSKEKIKDVIQSAKDNNCSIRIGVNAGSLEKKILEKYGEPNPEALVESALNNIKILEDNDFYNFKISVKASDVFLSIKAYESLSKKCNYPLHLGITEAGAKRFGSVKSSIGIGNLLLKGIGDTIRISLTDSPEEEVKVGFDILKSLNLRHRGVKIISCPSCARQQFEVINVVKKLEKSLEDVKTPITVSIIGCVVNGPGEATMTNIGITGGGNNTHMIYIDGEKNHRITNEDLVPYLSSLIRKKALEKKN
ncbi:MAG: 4-hydroxy-3-methylbut-2-en-1-yl diphosphate synthase (flavodoxin) [Alphaproteobacteria bacterium MarineAlpha5_Bin9]|nr:MAG: 4-hydroxy-3-methylbut-2-en-1-yl diphosphate synthase (flavodoxin) [Alphaproteobacteria bacterium MarineAlpha5_Bin9]|tara:strand:- start:11532 stop:12623 length:1092 start_codon:yes stop_codon:yes gene_type:complete